MKILIVDDEENVMRTLLEIASSETEHEVYGATNGEEAIDIVNKLGGLDLLITDVVMEPIDGFELRQLIMEALPDLLTIFISGYDLSDYESATKGHKILAKPVAPAQLLGAINAAAKQLENFTALKEQMRTKVELDQSEDVRAPGSQSITANLSHLMQKQGFTGKLDQFQLVDIIQMCCLSRRTGRLRVAKGVEKGVIFLQDGRILHAVCGKESGVEAVYKIISWDFGEFSLDEGIKSEMSTIDSGWEQVVMEGVRRHDETSGDRKKIADEGLEGKTVGDFKIQNKLGEGEWGVVYQAMQISVQRPVAMKVLRQDLHLNPEAVQEFIADASAKANVQHPAIISVYEAGEANGVYFYARELVNGYTLADVAAQGSTLDDQLALKVIRVVSEALSYFNHYKVSHAEIEAKNIYVDESGSPRLANLATVTGAKTVPVQKEISSLSKIVSAATQEGAAASAEVRSLLSKMKVEGNAGFLSWGALIQTVRTLEPKVVPKDAYKLSERDEAAIRAVETEKKRQKRAAILSTIGMILLLWLVVAAIYWRFIHNRGGKTFDEMVEIPAGEFIYQDGETKSLPAFWIDKHEISIGMYQKFLDYLEKNPTDEFDHKKQPAGKTHKPFKWDLMKEAATSKNVTFEGAKINLNMPVYNIDWWDAYAYASWRGRRLPTEEEWEKAARGSKGNIYPWGNEFDPKKTNSAIDMSANPTLDGDLDGYNRWAPVDAISADKSPYGVIGMAGNVAEWTGTWVDDPQGPGVVPVIRGGSYGSIDRDGSPDVKATKRAAIILPDDRNVRVGFRTVSEKAPQ